jgi:alpha-amylase/alpha-mannosidase (GH57 family)
MRVVILWHLHQPDYRVDGRFLRPWVYLHALAGYTEMAARLEECPAARAVVNITPVLIDQLDDYARRLHRWRQHGTAIGDALLDGLTGLPAPGPARTLLLRACLPERASPRTKRHPAYGALAEVASSHDPATIPDALLSDLLVWFHLAWLGPSLRESDPRAARLLAILSGFDRDAKRTLLELIGDALTRVLPRWRALAGEERVELSTSPYYHPLSPLLLDFASARERAPDIALPPAAYPGGLARLRWHLAEGRARFAACFGRPATGCWPSEAALSDATLRELAASGFEWTASSRSVLGAEPFRLFRAGETRLYCAFRDDGLSDRIGFEYQHWQAADAVRDLVHHLETIAREPGRDLVLIALDGENAWEYYPDDGREFLRGVYETLGRHETLRLATMKDCVRECAATAAKLPAIRAGSWVHGELLTWIGHPEKNRAWEWLIEAKRRYDERGGPDSALEHALGALEGSDWFWWPGEYNPSASVAQFDELFRARLAALYRSLGSSAPDALSRPFASGVAGEVALGGTMQRGT